MAGLAYATENDLGQRVDTGTGFLFSTNGGDTFRFTAPIADRVVDSTLVYGVSRLRAYSFLTPDGAAPSCSSSRASTSASRPSLSPSTVPTWKRTAPGWCRT